ncbi:hypothetical protein LOD99_1017 [Oopsacas minuta]|uniref:Uncharacterized protein n=1 Tax=Oopsacas minuta TaxID=111878 RepID=A0AAV7K0B0_9METZ|nr:hypothetical protein LOD99_1017 [Oopsacas minuta]
MPLTNHPEKRSPFYKLAPNKTPQSQQINLYPQLVSACKVISICAKCVRNRIPKNTPPSATPVHANIQNTTKSLWRSEEFNIQANQALLSNSAPFHLGKAAECSKVHS